MSIYYGLNAEAYDREYSDRELVRRILQYFVPHRRPVLIVSVLITAIALAGAVQPVVVGWGLDWLARSPTLLTISGLIAVVLGIGVFHWAGNWVRRRMIARIIGDVMLALRRDAFQAVMQHDMAFFDRFRSGRIISRITSDTQEFAQVVLLSTALISPLLKIVLLVI